MNASSTSFSPASLGFGCYRVEHNSLVHEAAMRLALDADTQSAVDCIDTSSNYGNGSSQLLVGKVLRSLPLASRPTLVTKMGYIQGDALDAAKAQVQLNMGLDDVVEISESAWHCIHPDYLDTTLSAAQEQCSTDCIDIVLLHNPEYYLQHAHQNGMDLSDARAEFDRRLSLAFEFLEGAVESGRITSYGISSNTFVSHVDAPDSVSLEHCVALAQRVGGTDNHFSTAQMPMNLIEHYAATLLNQDDGQKTTLERALELGIRVLVNRPLNAVVDGDIIRLASHEMPSHIVHPDDVQQRIHSLEIVEHNLVNAIVASGTLSEREVLMVREAFRIAETLCSSWSKFEGLTHWRQVRQAYLDPRIDAIGLFTERATDPESINSYHTDILAVLNDVDAIYAGEENESLEELRSILADEFGMPNDTPLQHIAVQALRCTPGVSTVLVGMRRPEYVEDISSVMDMPIHAYHRTTWNRVAAHLEKLSK